jgi:hypothetical protein
MTQEYYSKLAEVIKECEAVICTLYLNNDGP